MTMIAQVDWPETVEVRVTHEDVRDGEPDSSESCPVARAVSRALGGVNDVIIVYDEAWVGRGGAWRYYRLPPEASRFIERFDATTHRDSRHRLRPVSFTMTLLPVSGYS